MLHRLGCHSTAPPLELMAQAVVEVKALVRLADHHVADVPPGAHQEDDALDGTCVRHHRGNVASCGRGDECAAGV